MKRGEMQRSRGGFTLLEVMIAMGILVALIGTIVGIASTSMRLSNAVVERRYKESEKLAFVAMMERICQQLPGNARFHLTEEDNGRHVLSKLTLQNVPMQFNWGGQIIAAEAVMIETEVRRDAYLDIVLKFYEEELLEENGEGYLDIEPIAEVLLLEGVQFLEWQVQDSRKDEPDGVWLERGRQPRQLLMRAVFEPEGEEVSYTFWIVSKVSPEIAFRELLSGQGNPTNSGRDNGTVGGSGGAASPEIIEVAPDPSQGGGQ